MKNAVRRLALAVTVLVTPLVPLHADPDLAPAAILTQMQQVADWQLSHDTNTGPRGWIPAVGDAGMLALAGISGDTKYRDTLRSMGDTNGWKIGSPKGRIYHADDQCIGQTYAGLYFLYREPKMIAPLRARFDYIMAHPSATQSLDFTQKHGAGQQLWSWCDSLFMAPPAWLELSALTGDMRYQDYALTNFWRTTDFLYHPGQHLYFRDSTFLKKHEANGQPVFWSRGNGWVLAGIARMLQFLPANHPDRPRLEQLYRDFAAKVASLQQPDGFWHASLLNPAGYPEPESSGTALFTYGLTWGVNRGLLDRATFEPVIRKAWTALTGCVQPDGKFIRVQPAGLDPRNFPPTSTDNFGVGAFLLAGSEVYRLSVLENLPPVKITVSNPAHFWRENETVEVKLGGNLAVLDDRAAGTLASQVYAAEPGTAPDTLVFQVDLAPGETRTFDVIPATALAAVPPPLVKTMARFVPERYDDFAWESDRIAHRTYGLALIKAEGTISSGPDVWIKKNRGLIVDMMYRTKHYHYDNGEEMDDYRVGNRRGCGGLGIWDGQKLHVSSNYRSWKLITSGPIRSEFELTYDAWDAGNGRKVSEVRRISIDAGSWFSKMHTTLSSDDASPLTIGVGLAERACGSNGVEQITQDLTEGTMAYWQPEDRPKGITAVAIILPKGSVSAFTNDLPNLAEAKVHANVPQPTHEGAPPIRDLLAITQVQPGQPFEYYFGASWDRSGDFTTQAQWDAYVQQLAARRDQPLQVTISH